VALAAAAGSHHTKALLLRYPTGLRVIVLTGTLDPEKRTHFVQGVWWQVRCGAKGGVRRGEQTAGETRNFTLPASNLHHNVAQHCSWFLAAVHKRFVPHPCRTSRCSARCPSLRRGAAWSRGAPPPSLAACCSTLWRWAGGIFFSIALPPGSALFHNTMIAWRWKAGCHQRSATGLQANNGAAWHGITIGHRQANTPCS